MDVQGLSSRAIIGEYYARLERPNLGWVDQLAFYFDSNMPTETYAWLGQTPAMRQWLGGRAGKGLGVNGISITNKLYEASIEFDYEDFRRDKTGQSLVRVGSLADRTVTHWGSLLSTLILNGPSTACYDGKNFFATNHVEGDNQTSQSNQLTISLATLPIATAAAGTTTKPGILAMQNMILQAAQQIIGFLDDKSEPMNEDAMEFVVMVPIGMWYAAQGAVSLPFTDYGQTNLIPQLRSKSFNITAVANPRLTWTDRFAVFRTDASVKPFIRQDEYAPMLALLDEQSEYCAVNHKVLFGVNVSRGVGFGYWQEACQVIITA